MWLVCPVVLLNTFYLSDSSQTDCLIRRLSYGCVSSVGRQEHIYVHVSAEDFSSSVARGTAGCPEAAT